MAHVSAALVDNTGRGQAHALKAYVDIAARVLLFVGSARVDNGMLLTTARSSRSSASELYCVKLHVSMARRRSERRCRLATMAPQSSGAVRHSRRPFDAVEQLG